MNYSEAIQKIRDLDAELVRAGDPDLRSLKITDGQRRWLLHLGLSRALEILGEKWPAREDAPKVPSAEEPRKTEPSRAARMLQAFEDSIASDPRDDDRARCPIKHLIAVIAAEMDQCPWCRQGS